MKKKTKQKVCVLLTMVTTIGTNAVAFAETSKTAAPNNASVAVDGREISIGAYNIDGYNYFRLRDVAAALNETEANFEVGYDADASCITLKTNQAYTASGSELAGKTTETKSATVSSQKIMLDGSEVSMQAYLIDGYNYFQLRELGDNLGFEVTWDGEAKAINMVTKHTDATEDTQDTVVQNDGAQKLQAVIDGATELGEVTLEGTYSGNPGDKVIINHGMTLHGVDAVLSEITLEINTTEKVLIDGITFEGNSVIDNAIVINNVGTDSMITNCKFNNYLHDVILINKIEEGGLLTINENEFTRFGIGFGKLNGGITLNSTEKVSAHYEVKNNKFFLEKEILNVSGEPANIAFLTRPIENEKEIYSETHLTFLYNKTTKGTNTQSLDLNTALNDEVVWEDGEILGVMS